MNWDSKVVHGRHRRQRCRSKGLTTARRLYFTIKPNSTRRSSSALSGFWKPGAPKSGGQTLHSEATDRQKLVHHLHWGLRLDCSIQVYKHNRISNPHSWWQGCSSTMLLLFSNGVLFTRLALVMFNHRNLETQPLFCNLLCF